MIDSIHPYEIKQLYSLGPCPYEVTYRGAELGMFSTIEEAAQRIAKDVADGYPELVWDFVAEFAQDKGVQLSKTLVEDDRFQESLAEEIIELQRGPSMKMGR